MLPIIQKKNACQLFKIQGLCTRSEAQFKFNQTHMKNLGKAIGKTKIKLFVVKAERRMKE